MKKNISAFGGDPDQITVFGQSGGGGKSVMMLTTPLTDGIVKGAIMQSGGGVDMTRGELHLKEAEENGKKVIDFMGYASVDEARKASPEELLKKIREYCDNNPLKMMGLFGPNADGYVFPEALESPGSER